MHRRQYRFDLKCIFNENLRIIIAVQTQNETPWIREKELFGEGPLIAALLFENEKQGLQKISNFSWWILESFQLSADDFGIE